MAILNEYAIMGPNYFMLVIGIIGVICGLVMLYLSSEVIGTSRAFLRSFVFILSFVIIGISSYNIVAYDDPEFQIRTGKTQIEATFANGEIPAVYLKKYNVIDVDDNVYLLEEKDGVKEDNRPIVKLGEVK